MRQWRAAISPGKTRLESESTKANLPSRGAQSSVWWAMCLLMVLTAMHITGGPDELTLDDIDGAVVIIDEDGVNLLVVCPVRIVGLGLALVPKMDVTKIPGHKLLPVVRKVLAVVILLDFFFDLVEHRSP